MQIPYLVNFISVQSRPPPVVSACQICILNITRAQCIYNIIILHGVPSVFRSGAPGL